MNNNTRYITQEGDRWDTIAWKAYGDATRYGEIVRANPAIPIRAIIPAGTIVNVPVLSGTEAPTQTNLPPWKR